MREKPKHEYRFFKEKTTRNNFREASKDIGNYLRENKIKNVVLVDKSARPLWAAIKKTNPEIKIHFLSPKKKIGKKLERIIKEKRIALIDDYTSTGLTLFSLHENLKDIKHENMHFISFGSAAPKHIYLNPKSLIKLHIGKENIHHEEIVPWSIREEDQKKEENKHLKGSTGIKYAEGRRKPEENKENARKLREEIKKVLETKD